MFLAKIQVSISKVREIIIVNDGTNDHFKPPMKFKL